MFISWYDKDIPNNRSDILAEHVKRDVLERLRSGFSVFNGA